MDQLTPTHDLHPVAANDEPAAQAPALTPEQQRREAALSVVDQLREAVADGKVSAFVGVVLFPDDNTAHFVGAPSDVTRLRIGGAIHSLGAAFARNEI